MRLALGIVSLAAVSLLATSARANLIVNGGFEVPAVGDGTYGQFLGGSTGITGWTVSGSDVLLIDNTYSESPDVVPFAPNGSMQSLDVTGSGNTGFADGVFQSIATSVGTFYSISFYVGRAQSNDDPNSESDDRYKTPSTVRLSIGGGTPIAFTNSDFTTGTTNWKRFSATFTATSAATLIAFTNGTDIVANGGNNFAGLDDVTVEAVPEPSGLAALGLGAIALRRRARR